MHDSAMRNHLRVPYTNHRLRPLLLVGGAAVALVAAGTLEHVMRTDASMRPRPGAVAPVNAAWKPAGDVGSRNDDIGIIGDVAIGPDRRLYVLDVARQRVGWLVGETFGWTGRPGRGPGEFTAPAALVSMADGTLYVADRGNRRLEQYAAQGEGLVRVQSLALDFDPQDLCAVGNQLIVLGVRGELSLHEISRTDGRVMRSFGRDELLRDPLLATHRAAGYLACGPGDVIAYLPLIRGTIHRYSASTGEELEPVRIPGFREVIVRRGPGTVTLIDPPEGTADCAASLVVLPGGDLLVQIGTVRAGGTPHEFEEIRSYLLSSEDGTIRPIASRLPRILTPAPGGYAAVETDPLPRVRLVQLYLSQR